MKNKFSIHIIITVIITSLLGSCTDWMELEPEDELIRQEFWQKEGDVEAVTAAMYDAFRETSLKSLMMGEVRGDMMWFNAGQFYDYAKIAESDIQYDNPEVKWEKYYFTINLANTLIQFMPEVLENDELFTATEMERIHAEALFIRSLTYFYLVRLYKDVPLLLSASSSDTVDFYIEESDEAVVLDQIISDLEYAETIAISMENIDENTSKFIYDLTLFKGRANKYSIQALLADVYLWKEDYQKCIDYCNKVIDSKLFSLENENDWFKIYVPGNSKESIFEVQYSEANKETNPIYDKLLPTGSPPRAYFYDWVEEELFLISDVRIADDRFGPISKYIMIDIEGNDGLRRDYSQRDANFIYYRYADILLMKAEALAELNNFFESQELINEVAIRAGNPSVFLEQSIAEFRTAILTERAREFAFEGKRWFDLLRFAKRNWWENKNLVINILLSKASDEKRPILRGRILDPNGFYLPIPEADIKYNDKLNQNPYYDR
ncbi:MAG: RagB/SusD family nutrient uptake outer membrane protein [Bacteroidales bacterium]|nr:MAG: RagB/SusD family nutrient uptake outer membrane protein [Bacteroidales bacterium]